jgi:hypothetical protein
MKRFFLILLALVMTTEVAWPLTQSSIPPKIAIPWANNAGAAYIRSIPSTSQIGIQNCAASYHDGFPPLTFTPSGAGGCPPFGQDFNGVLKQITQWIQWQAVSSGLPWDSSFSTAIGGYPKGAIAQSNVLSGRLWFSTADNNTTNPDSTSSSGWIVLPGTNQPGTPIASLSGTPPVNSVPANGSTIGNASSNASGRANADTLWLFTYVWNNCLSTTCSLFNSAGGAISRGATAIADFNANDAIATIDMRGRGAVGIDQGGTSRLTGVPIITGNPTSTMSYIGENFHTLSLGEIPTGINAGANNTITVVSALSDIVQEGSGFVNEGTGGGAFTFTAFPLNSASVSAITSSANNFISVVSSNTGGGAHNNVEQNVTVYWCLSL